MPILNMIYWATWWGGWWWQPWANTIAYYQFDNNLNDSSGNSHNFSMATWTPTYWTASWGAKYIHFTQWTYTTNITIPYTTSAYTINVRLKYDWTDKCFIDIQPQTNSQWWNRWGYLSSTSLYICSWSGTTVTGLDLTNWINVVAVLNGSTAETYINGVLKNTTSIVQAQTTANYFRLNTVWYGGSTSVYTSNAWNNYMSELILESKSWTAQEISDYYNNTKANYWIS